MRILVDTNILGRLCQPRHSMHDIVAHAVEKLCGEGHELRIVPQCLYEFWVVATRSVELNGLALSITEAEDRLRWLKRLFPPLRDERGILEPWERLVVAHRVMGKPAHDARLVAAMERHGLSHLLTFNAGDFQRFPGVSVIAPSQVASP